MARNKNETALMILTFPYWLPLVLLGAFLGSMAKWVVIGLTSGWQEPMGFLPDKWTDDHE